MEKWHIIWTNITIFHIYEESIKKKTMRDIDIWGDGGGGWSTTCCINTNNGENVNVTPILCNTGVNVRIMICFSLYILT
jgi:hypothetical protein